MSKFIGEDFMLTNKVAEELYHEHAAKLPIIDYHCHLVPEQIAGNYQARNITEMWLGGDHYKWRAMRGNGVSEDYITGDKSDYEKFEKWAYTLQYSMRNPLYHWTHLELSRIFGIDEVLNPSSARKIYDECNQKINSEEFRAQAIMRSCNVEVVCTTDDPIDNLEYHKQIADNPFGTKVLPTWRADKVLAIDNPEAFNQYIDKLAAAADMDIATYEDLMAALANRQDFFASMGCKLSDHGLDTFYADNYTESDLMQIFAKVRSGQTPSPKEISQYRSGVLFDLAAMDSEKDWTQQFHIGVIRNNNSRMFKKIGADTGFDSIHDLPCSVAGNKYFDRLTEANKLAKTILYNLNPKDNEVLATMAYNFNDGSVAGKMQLGSGWWFLDQEDGMRKQINALSALGLLSRFVGMLTDSRSFLSYPRHEYFRRILCNIIGQDVVNGKLPKSEMEFIGKMVEDISYYNAKNYFDF